MVGLVAYDSSDEDEEIQDQPETSADSSEDKSAQVTEATVNGSSHGAGSLGRLRLTASSRAPSAEQEPKNPQPSRPDDHPPPAPGGPSMVYSAPIGPALGPSRPPVDSDDRVPATTYADADSFLNNGAFGSTDPGTPSAVEAPPGSPWTRERALMRDLTLPAIPTLDLPPSPVGRDPSPGLNARLERFLALKRKGEHFNARLAGSSAMMNPGVMDKLMAFVGIEGEEQYVTTVGREVFDPVDGFPQWAGRERLKEAVRLLNQEVEDEKRKRGPRDAIEFVPASSSSSTFPRPK